MTSSKVIYLIATIVPFGFVLLAGAILIHRMIKKRSEAYALVRVPAKHKAGSR